MCALLLWQVTNSLSNTQRNPPENRFNVKIPHKRDKMCLCFILFCKVGCVERETHTESNLVVGPIYQAHLVAHSQPHISNPPRHVGFECHWAVAITFPADISAQAGINGKPIVCLLGPIRQQEAIHHGIVLSAIVGLPTQKTATRSHP